MFRKNEKGQWSMMVGGVIVIIVLIVAFFIAKQGIIGQGKEIGRQFDQAGDDDGDSIPNLLDKCCPAACAASKDEIGQLSPDDERYGCTPEQKPTSCRDQKGDCKATPEEASGQPATATTIS